MNNFDVSQTCFHCEWHPMSEHFSMFAITGNYEGMFTEILFHLKAYLIVFRLQQLIYAEITYVQKYLKRKRIFLSTLLICHCGRKTSQEKHDVTDSLSHAVLLENGSCLNLLYRNDYLMHYFLTGRTA